MASNPSVTGSTKPGSGGAPADPELKTLGKYAIRKRLGAGGMGAVYLATDTQSNRTVALKVLPRDKAENKTLVKRFKAEAQAAAHLKHDNIVTIYETGAADGHLYIALEYVEGIDVHVLVSKRGVLPVKRSLDIIKQVTRALEHAHGQGIVHRDIKPSNLLIKRDGTVKLADMGLARSIDDTTETGITRAGTTVGTVDYMAPEQARDSKSADVRSDIYSLGCTWYQMLTGSPPYPEGSLTNKLHAHATKPPPDPREKNEAVPEAIVAVLHRMMAKSPDDRYQTPAELLADLESANLTREGVANQILAALADEEETADFEDKAALAAKRVPPPTPVPEAVYESDSAEEAVSAAPRTRKGKKRPQLPEPKANAGLDVGELLRYLPLLIVAAIVIAVVWFALSWLASLEDGSELPPNQNPFAKDRLDVPEEAAQTPGNSALASNATGTKESATKENAGNSTSDGGDGKRVAEQTDGSGQPTEAPARSLLATADVSPPVAIGRAGERQHFPSWVDDVWARPVGAESSRSARAPPRLDGPPVKCLVPPLPGLPSLIVGRTLAGPSHFATLGEAFAALPNEGGLVQLVGDGPFFLRPTQLSGYDRVVITAAYGSQPLVLLVPDDASEPSSEILFQLTNGSLVLDSVHLALVASQFPASDRVGLIGVQSGNLAVRNSSVTLLGTRSAPTAAFVIAADAEDSRGASRILFDRTVIRGEGLTGLHVDHRQVDLLAANCLFATGSSPAVALTDRRRATEGIADQASLRRVLRFVSTTTSASKTALKIDAGRTPAQPVSTTLVSVNSIFARTESANPTGILLTLTEWPRSRRTDRAGSRFRNLQFTTESSLFLGWDELVRLEPGPATRITSTSEWERNWGHRLKQPQFQAIAWPESLIAWSEFSPDTFRRDSIQAAQVLATDSGRPGCAVDELRVPSQTSVRRALGWAQRPPRPESLLRGRESQTVTIPLDEQTDLGQALAEAELPRGARVVIEGQGRHRSTPIHIDGKSLRLEFQPDSGASLIIEPEPPSTNPSDGHRAFFTVTDSTVEIINGHFEMPREKAESPPLWFMNASASHFLLKNCRVVGDSDSKSRAGLIHWNNRDARPPNSQTAGAADRGLGLILDSFLAHSGPLVAARGVSHLAVSNSICLAGGPMFDLDAAGTRPVMDIRHCTLAAGEAFFQSRPAVSDPGESPPLTFFVEETAFLPNGRRVVLVNLSESEMQTGKISWWGSANGFGEGIVGFSAESDRRARRRRGSFLTRWERLWGAARVQHPTILSRSEFPNLSGRRGSDWNAVAFAPGGVASQWGDGGKPIGARIAAVKQDPAGKTKPTAVSETDSTRPPSEKSPRTPKKPKPAF